MSFAQSQGKYNSSVTPKPNPFFWLEKAATFEDEVTAKHSALSKIVRNAR